MLVSNCGLPKALSHGVRWTFGESHRIFLDCNNCVDAFLLFFLF